VDIRFMVGTVGLIVVALAYGRWQSKINFGITVGTKWIGRFLIDPKTCKTAETFCNEVAVLWFVFPLLDTIYEHKNPDTRLLHDAYKVSAMFFLFAVILSHASDKSEKED
jgi:hypothetical protein